MTTFGFVCGFAAEARLLRSFPHVTHGDGGVAGARKAIAALSLDGVTALVSFGVAGGLDPALKPGALLIPDEVLSGERRFAVDAGIADALRKGLPGALGGRLVAGTGLLASPADKAALWGATGAMAVDLESGAVAEFAQARRLPFVVVRAVADPAGASLPPAAQIPLSAAGTPNLPAIFASILRSPGQIPRLIGLAMETNKALAALREAVPVLARA